MSAPPLPHLGMHRSGTSAATLLLSLAGAPLPPAATPGRTSNPRNARGFFEVRPLTALNEDVLRALDGEWSAPPPLADGWPGDERLAPLRPRADRAASRHLKAPGSVWKDPRLCLTLPFWSAVVPATAPVVITVRAAGEVAASLADRDGFDRAFGFALWERYLRAALAAAAGRPAFVWRYDEILGAPAASMAAARDWLDSVGVPLGPAAGDDEASAAMETDLRHGHDAEPLSAGPDVTAAQAALDAALRDLTGVHAALTVPPLPPVDAGSAAVLEARRQSRAGHRAASARWSRRLRRRATIGASTVVRQLRRG